TMILWRIVSYVLLIFVGLLFVIVLIVMGHSISTEVEIDYVNLGILKAQGFTSKKIRRIILLGYLLCELAGGIIGCLIALPLSLSLGRVMMQYTAILPSGGLSSGKFLLFLLAVLLISAATVGIKTRRVGKISPMRAISGGREEIYFDSRLQLPIRRRGLLAGLALRQLTSCKRRYSGTVFIVAILTFFMFSINLLGNLFSSKSALEAMGAEIDDITIKCLSSFTEAHEQELEALVEGFSPIRKKYYTTTTYMSINGENLRCECYKYPEYINGILKGRAPMYDNEILITEMIAEILEIKMGDSVIVSNNDLESEFIVSGIYQSAYDSGLNFAISLDGAKKLGIEKITYIGLCIEDDSRSTEIVDALNREFPGIIEAELFDFDASILNDGMIDGIVAVFKAVIYTFSVLFALVVVEMVCSKSFAKERTDIGILKAVGFSCAGLRLSFALRFLVLSLPGSALGMALSAAFSAKLIGGVLSMAGFSRVHTEFTFSTVLVPVLLMGICFFAFAYTAARRIKKVEVRELVAE
ncbi:MAG: FtsX-like permease family protein, partial [Lachnospiraceae bacterium]|nr:FtsX-like permease family protein [Lachnospiraceae bacterium]